MDWRHPWTYVWKHFPNSRPHISHNDDVDDESIADHAAIIGFSRARRSSSILLWTRQTRQATREMSWASGKIEVFHFQYMCGIAKANMQISCMKKEDFFHFYGIQHIHTYTYDDTNAFKMHPHHSHSQIPPAFRAHSTFSVLFSFCIRHPFFVISTFRFGAFFSHSYIIRDPPPPLLASFYVYVMGLSSCFDAHLTTTHTIFFSSALTAMSVWKMENFFREWKCEFVCCVAEFS